MSVAQRTALDSGELVVELRLPSRAERLKLVRLMVGEVARTHGCGDACAQDMVIAVDEACQNVIRHAYGGDPDGEIRLEIRRADDRLILDLVDYASPVDESRVKSRDLDDLRPGGLGVHLIHECMDEARFVTPPEGAGNRLRMIKRITRDRGDG